MENVHSEEVGEQWAFGVEETYTARDGETQQPDEHKEGSDD